MKHRKDEDKVLEPGFGGKLGVLERLDSGAFARGQGEGSAVSRRGSSWGHIMDHCLLSSCLLQCLPECSGKLGAQIEKVEVRFQVRINWSHTQHAKVSHVQSQTSRCKLSFFSRFTSTVPCGTCGMSDPPAALVGQGCWAKEAISHVKGAHGMNDSLLWSQKCLGTSSMFSGAVFPERAFGLFGCSPEDACCWHW